MSGYAVYEWTHYVDPTAGVPNETRSLLIELSDSAINPLTHDLSIPRDLNVSDARLIGAINLSALRPVNHIDSPHAPQGTLVDRDSDDWRRWTHIEPAESEDS